MKTLFQIIGTMLVKQSYTRFTTLTPSPHPLKLTKSTMSVMSGEALVIGHVAAL